MVTYQPPPRVSIRSGQPARRETVNVVITAVLLAGLVCLLIVGGIAHEPDGPPEPRPSARPPLTHGSGGWSPSSAPAVTGSPR